MGKLKKILRDEGGEIMLESSIIFIMTIILLIGMISVGFVFYQQAMMNTIASEIASDIASDYKITDSDNQSEIKLFRTSIAVGSMEKIHKQNAENMLPDMVKIRTLGLTGDSSIDNFDIKVDNIGRLHVEVTVSLKAKVLFDQVLKYLGIIDDTLTFSATGRAECLDLSAYAGHVHFSQYLSSELGNSKFVDTITEYKEKGKNIKDFITGLFGN